MSDHEHNETESDEVYGDENFSVGEEILIETHAGVVAGVFLGFSEFGIVYNATHQVKQVAEFVTEEIQEAIRKEFASRDDDELDEMLAEIGHDEVDESRTWKVMILTEYSVNSLNDEGTTQRKTVALKRPVRSLIMWSQVISMSAYDDMHEEMILAEFASSLDKGFVFDESEPLVGPDGPDA